MRSVTGFSSVISGDSGATAVIVGLMMIVLVGFAALAIDFGYSMVTKNELQNIADASSLAATRRLGVIYESMSYQAQQNYDAQYDAASIRQAAVDVAFENRSGGKHIVIKEEEVFIGKWSSTGFTETLLQPNAVKVIARRDGNANGPITTFFAKIFGTDLLNIWADATSALTGQSTAGPGGLPIPAGISYAWFLNKETYCNQPIKFYPTNTPEGCAGWHTYTDDFFSNQPASANKLGNILDSLTYLPGDTRRLESPVTTAGITRFEFTGGTVASAFPDMLELFNAMKVLNDGVVDADNDPNTWTTAVVVYDWPNCSNPNPRGNPGTIPIVGFATVVITEVLVTPEKTINGRVLCNFVEPGRGGGNPLGTLGSIPGLVE